MATNQRAVDAKHYRVTWTIDVFSERPVDAAVLAHKLQQKPWTATVFEVRDMASGKTAEIDLGKYPGIEF